MHPRRLGLACTPSGMCGRTMVVVAYLRGDLSMGCFSFHCGGWFEVLGSIVISSSYAFGRPITSSTSPSCFFSVSIVCDRPNAATYVWFGAIAFTLWAPSSSSGHEALPASLAFWPCPISSISMSMTTIVVGWVSSTTDVGLAGSKLGEGILSKLTNSIVSMGSCSIPCGCCGVL
jgi:hypothetical protein